VNHLIWGPFDINCGTMTSGDEGQLYVWQPGLDYYVEQFETFAVMEFE
jgi:hypothetical protein